MLYPLLHFLGSDGQFWAFGAVLVFFFGNKKNQTIVVVWFFGSATL
jgi:hypothetical protein